MSEPPPATPPPTPPPPGGGGGGPSGTTPGAGGTPGASTPATGQREATWRVERATRELDRWTAATWENTRKHAAREVGPVEGTLDAKLEQRNARLGMFQKITQPSAEEQALARTQSDHALLQQMHQGARATDKLPQPLFLGMDQSKAGLRHAQDNEQRQAMRLRDLNSQYANAKAQGADATTLARIEAQRAKERQIRDAAREMERNARADLQAIERRTQDLKRANDEHGRVMSRTVAAARTLAERGIKPSKWASTIAYPTREEERAIALGGRQTQQEIAAENQRDRARSQQAIRDRAQLGQLIAAQQPPQKARARSKTRNPRGRGRGR